MPSTPTTTPTRDIRIGRPAATRVPSITISTMKAMTIPATSPVCEPPPSADSLRFASNCTVAPCRFADSMSDMTFCNSADGTS